MKRSRDWYRHRSHVLVQFLMTSGIPMPWSDDRPSEDGRLPKVEPPSFTPLKRTKRDVVHDLAEKFYRAPSRHRYSEATKIFAFTADMFSCACYRFMRGFWICHQSAPCETRSKLQLTLLKIISQKLKLCRTSSPSSHNLFRILCRSRCGAYCAGMLFQSIRFRAQI
jgi:hypothetical protein